MDRYHSSEWQETYIVVIVVFLLAVDLWELGLVKFPEDHVLGVGAIIILSLLLRPTSEGLLTYDDEFDMLFFASFKEGEGGYEDEGGGGRCHVELVIVFASVETMVLMSFWMRLLVYFVE